MSRLIAIAALILLAAIGLLSAFFSPASIARPSASASLPSGWGIDACLSVYAPRTLHAAWLRSINAANLVYLRERGLEWIGSAGETYPTLVEAGYKVVAFSTTPGVKSSHSWDQLPEDLLAVYEASRRRGRKWAGAVSIWELPNEPDTMFCYDLPDRLVAYSKAAYLGLTDGRRRASQPGGVLMSALGCFPGPWLERAAENGLYDYTDGLNVHFYGHARDFRDGLRAQVAFAARWTGGRKLPVWVTEAGIDATDHADLAEARGREIQKWFTLETARVALEEGVAVFMPFVLTWPKEEWFALAHSPTEPYPAWTAYAGFTRAHSLPAQSALVPPANPSRVVLQWQPDYQTCIPHKVSGSYWFRGGGAAARPMRGRMVLYNFSAEPVVGTLTIEADETVRLVANRVATVAIPAFGRTVVPLKIEPAASGYLRANLRFRFGSVRETERPSRAMFAVETPPSAKILPRRLEILGRCPASGDFSWIWAPEPTGITTAGGAWRGVGPVVPRRSSAAYADLGAVQEFVVVEGTTDPRRPPMAVTRVEGLPGGRDAFLRVRFPDGDRTNDAVRVDLIDDRGQRFSIAENLGQNRFRPNPRQVLFAYRDFQIYAWGRCTKNPAFRPEAVREIQLRFYSMGYPAKYRIRLDALAPE